MLPARNWKSYNRGYRLHRLDEKAVVSRMPQYCKGSRTAIKGRRRYDYPLLFELAAFKDSGKVIPYHQDSPSGESRS